MEHCRGGFPNNAMRTPLGASSLSIAVSLHGTCGARQGSHCVRDVVHDYDGYKDFHGGCRWMRQGALPTMNGLR